MRNVIGHPARGNDFFQRDREINKIKRSLKANNHLQIAAPRRVGKTSILMYFLDNEQNHDYYFVYVDVEATASESDFYRKLYEGILRSEVLTNGARILNQIKSGGNTFLKRIKGVNLIEGSIEFNSEVQLDYYDQLKSLLKGLSFGSKKLIVLIDEFPYAINNLISEGHNTNALSLLKSKRALRQDPSLSSKVQFVYTGSISLNATVESICASELVNDIDSISISTLNETEAKEFILAVTSEEALILDDDSLGYMVKKVGWLIPFHIQLYIKELFELYDESAPKEVTEQLLDKAFQGIIDFRNNNYFEHYSSRLKKLYKGSEFRYAYDVLSYAASNDRIHKSEIFNIAAKYNLDNQYKSVVHNLVYDGYIYQEADNYMFNSSLIKMWWKSYVN